MGSNLNHVQPCKKITKGREWEDCVNLSLLKVLIFCVDMRPFKFSHHITSLVRCEHLVGSKLQREKFTFNHLTNHALLKISEVKIPSFFFLLISRSNTLLLNAINTFPLLWTAYLDPDQQLSCQSNEFFKLNHLQP